MTGHTITGTLVVWLAACAAAILTTLASRREHRERGDQLAFDLLRALAITTYGWVATVTVSLVIPRLMIVLVEPGVLAMPPETALFFVSLALGWIMFAWFRLQVHRGTHPWHRKEHLGQEERAGN